MERKAGGARLALSSPLYNPNDAIVDIVFIHGLGGHRENTWTKYNVFWPQRILPEDVPKARIWSWGYDADLLHFWNKHSNNALKDHSSQLCSDLAGVRVEAPNRPILFVVHSLGGIVCENAMVQSTISADEHIKQIAACTKGIIFLGTPLEGSKKTKWAEIGHKFASLVGQAKNKDVVEAIKDSSRRLYDLRDKFGHILRSRAESKAGKIEVVCFYEEFDSPIGRIVTKESATILSYEAQSIPADHSEMCKFACKTEPGYERVSKVLKRWVDALEKPVPDTPTLGDIINMQINEVKGGNVSGKHNGNSTMTITYN
ncbi:esterase/lipase family protein [Aspergillus melleus]|uniref:esterase/lipase family protein n=1 Tax=Aspergillus melleus TaxID=138277 RepID=UPI001E8EAE93|nr:uncharacterized protein LDX57_007150 [Aspergillus melleus]KAH8429488.1 hypothetical protein LDX57_007150 [Aspergillus melleus]